MMQFSMALVVARNLAIARQSRQRVYGLRTPRGWVWIVACNNNACPFCTLEPSQRLTDWGGL